MEYLTSLLLGLILSLGIAFSPNAVNADYETPIIVEQNLGECTKTVKTSTGWSFRTKEETITGPCDEILN